VQPADVHLVDDVAKLAGIDLLLDGRHGRES
jgi:hypothetical protein